MCGKIQIQSLSTPTRLIKRSREFTTKVWKVGKQTLYYDFRVSGLLQENHASFRYIEVDNLKKKKKTLSGIWCEIRINLYRRWINLNHFCECVMQKHQRYKVRRASQFFFFFNDDVWREAVGKKWLWGSMKETKYIVSSKGTTVLVSLLYCK